MASLRDRPEQPPAASGAEPVPNVHRQNVTRPLPVATFMVTQAFELMRIVISLAYPLFQVHHRRGVARRD
jgi:hypothetical protein